MNATKWHKRSAARFEVEAHVSPRTVTSSNREVRGVQIVLSGPVGSDDQNWLEVTMTADEAEEIANRLHAHAKIAREAVR